MRYAQREGLTTITRHHGVVPNYIHRCQLKNLELKHKDEILKRIKQQYPRIYREQEECFGLAMHLSDEHFTEYKKVADTQEEGIIAAYLYQLGRRFTKKTLVPQS